MPLNWDWDSPNNHNNNKNQHKCIGLGLGTPSGWFRSEPLYSVMFSSAMRCALDLVYSSFLVWFLLLWKLYICRLRCWSGAWKRCHQFSAICDDYIVALVGHYLILNGMAWFLWALVKRREYYYLRFVKKNNKKNQRDWGVTQTTHLYSDFVYLIILQRKTYNMFF